MRPSGPTVVPAIADHALSVSDADDEVRHVLRLVVDAARRAQLLGRIAVLYGTRDLHARLIGDTLDAAGIPGQFVDSQRRHVALGRSLLKLALPDHDLSRHDVTAWLAGAPIRGVDNRPAPVGVERASRRRRRSRPRAVGSRLGRHADDLEADAARAERDDEQEWRAEQLPRRSERARPRRLHHHPRPGAAAGRQATSWSGLANWCRSLVRTYLGGESLRGDWPPEEQAAAQRIDAAIDRLGNLTASIPTPRQRPSASPRTPTRRRSRPPRHLGNGVLVGTAAAALGLELDEVIVVGMAEGSFPARRRDDPLLPDRYRAVVSRSSQRSELVHDDDRALLATMAAASRVTLTFPRGDLRRNAERAPSRWSLDTTEGRTGCGPPPSASLLVPASGSSRSPSFVAGLTHRLPHVPRVRHRSLLDHTRRVARSPNGVPARPEVRTGAELLTARLSPDYTRFDGNLATDGDLRGVVLPDPTGPGQVVSATRLEKWAVCPHAYFVRHVLGVSPVEDPEEQYRISPLALGSLVHDTLDTWITEALHSELSPSPALPGRDAAIDHLRELAEQEASRLQQRGLVGRRVDRGRPSGPLRDLEDFVDFDNTQRAAFSSRPIATELPFGMPGSLTPPVEIPLADGRTLAVRGAIDRQRDSRRHRDRHRLQDRLGPLLQGHLRGRPHPGRHPSAARAVQPCRPPDPAATRCAEPRPLLVRHGQGRVLDGRLPRSSRDRGRHPRQVGRIVDGIAAGHFPAHPAAPGYRTWVDCPTANPTLSV